MIINRTQAEFEIIEKILRKTFEHNISVMGEAYSDWKLEFEYPNSYVDRVTNKALGYCSYKRKTVVMSIPYCYHGTLEDIADTLLHEMAHIITQGDGHGTKWRNAAVMLGANPRSKTMLSKETVLSITNDKWYIVSKQHNNTLIVEGTAGRKLKRLNDKYVQGRESETKNKLYLIARETYLNTVSDEERLQHLVR